MKKNYSALSVLLGWGKWVKLQYTSALLFLSKDFQVVAVFGTLLLTSIQWKSFQM